MVHNSSVRHRIYVGIMPSQISVLTNKSATLAGNLASVLRLELIMMCVLYMIECLSSWERCVTLVYKTYGKAWFE